MTLEIKYDLVDGEPVGNRECPYHSNEKCTLMSHGTYLKPCLPSHQTVCVPGLRAQRDLFKSCLADFAEGDCWYGDNCPTFGSRHGRCNSCIARSALAKGTK